tara:strand:+ start:276 stop:509 length:234 start_codon:yes stop_codon:yes gene_type:complete
MLINNHNNKKISYVGWTNNLTQRIKKHNSGTGAKFTRGRKWKLIYYSTFKTKKEAMSAEYKLKKNRKQRQLIYKNLF